MVELRIQCANCGGSGHVYKKCNHPLISYGIICYRMKQNIPEYLMVQRKDSLSYVEFIRGKYNIDNKRYIISLCSNMTVNERTKLISHDFLTLWNDLWQTEDCRGFHREYSDAIRKFEILKKGYIMRSDTNMYFFDIKYIIDNSVSLLSEPEWGFPKGRRNINENDVACALREFKEETGILTRHLHITYPCKPFEEVFSGSNNMRYKHVYYVAECDDIASKKTFNPENKMQAREIQNMKWFNFESAQKMIRPGNVERKELFKRVNVIVSRNGNKF